MAARMKAKSLGILTQIIAAGLPVPETEQRFHPTRRWRFDWMWRDLRIGLEREGSTWSGGRHTSGKGYAGDCVKYSEAAILGWLVIRFTADMERDGTALDLIRRAILARQSRGG